MLPFTFNYRHTDIPKLLGVGVLYFLVADITNQYFQSIGMIIAEIRPNIGLALGIVLVAGHRYWPALFVGAFASRLALDYSVVGALLVATGVAGGSLLGSFLLHRDKKFDVSLSQTFHFARLLLWAGVIGASFSAISGTVALFEEHELSGASLGETLIQWWLGDALGIALVTPLLLVWKSQPREWLDMKQGLEVAVYLAITFLAGQIIYVGWFSELFGKVALGYWMFAFLIWGAARFGLHMVVLVLPMVMIQSLYGAATHVGFFANDIAKSHLSNIWFYLLCLSFVGMELGAAINALKRAEKKIHHLALHDSLTGLANRTLFSDRFSHAILMAKRERHRVGIIFHDLDKFKPVNDNFGHHIGDFLLIEVANRLKECCRESDTIARLGGDEFVILLPNVAGTDDVLHVANNVHNALTRPFAIDGKEINISTSIGVAIYPEHGNTESELMVNADNAMYCAKKSGRNAVQLFNTNLPRVGRGQ